jgi:hypothetical protein
MDWSEVDFVVTRRRMGEDDQVQALEGRVVEDGTVREQPIELGVAQVIDYIAEGGVFVTGRESLGSIEQGGKLEILEEQGGEQLRLRAVEGTEEKFYLESLPAYQESDESPD